LTGTNYGILLPHFGEHASWDRILKGARAAERLGFHSVWVRDHLVFHPHGMEGTDQTFLEPFTVLTAVAAVTERLVLGTGSIIPHRHPILGAQLIAALSTLSGGRVIAGYGAGNFDHEFEAIGVTGVERPELVREQVTIFRRLWSGETVTREEGYYRFSDVALKPTPVAKVPIWYCGGTPASTRHAIEYCDGWMPGRITIPTYKRRVGSMIKAAEEAGRAMPTLASIPITSPGKTRSEALAKVSVDGLLNNANGQRFWVKPPHGEFRTPEDLDGSFIFGSSDDMVQQVGRYLAVGIDLLVFDLRFRFSDFDECLAQLGEEVLPKLRAA